ncbi:hypothetical protein ACF0H5_006826 [Mactra antiquata]
MLDTQSSITFSEENMDVEFRDHNVSLVDQENIDDLYEGYYYDMEETSSQTFVRYLYLIVFPYFLLVGTIGNLIGMAILRRYSHNVWSTCKYMSLLFPMDLIKLYVECGNDWLNQVYSNHMNLSEEILLLSNAVCKVYTFIYNLLLIEREWVMVAVAIETAIAFRKPYWTYTMCTRERANAIILFISVLLISLNLHFFWTFGLVKPGDDPAINSYLCTYINELSDRFRDSIWPIIQLCIQQAIPLAIISLCIVLSASSVFSSQQFGEEKYLEKYFLDVKSLQELKRATLITCIFTIISIISEMVRQGVQFGLIEMEFTPSLLTLTVMISLSYFIMSHKFLIFYICCVKFRYDVKHIILSLCKPFKNKCNRQRSYNTSSSLKANSQEPATSWQETEMMENLTN